jgi:hypothetical protein
MLIESSTTIAASSLTVGTASAAIRVYLVATRLNDHGQLYQVRLHDPVTGRIIAHGTLDPEHTACRSLLRLGYRGYLEIWSADGITLRSIIKDIAKSAGIRVCDDPSEGLRVRKLPMSANNDNALPTAIAS